MTVLVDTCVWSLLFRKHGPARDPEVGALRDFLSGTELVATTGTIVQELFYGLGPTSIADAVARSLRALAYIAPTLDDHIAAAALRRRLRGSGVQVGSADALIAHLAVEHDLTLLTTDNDFVHVARQVPLRLWNDQATGPGT